ncbi:MAG TPA: putative peptidoglycan glycosyltransferase FtsW [Solirubrobacterales bacterium]|nr:putative peptidoglycan glycosyltransferase FtsW [Solirubrobacterales bacterium]
MPTRSPARGGKSVLPKKRPPRKKAKVPTSLEYNLLLTATLILLAGGAVMVFSASSTTRILSDGGLSDSAFYLKKTLIVAVIGLILMHFVARRNLSGIRDKTPLFVGLTLAGLMAVLVLGTAVNGTKGWFIAGPIQIQPAEFLKLALVLYGAYFFANRPDRLTSVREMGPYLLLTAGACALVMLQPDMGTMMVALFAVAITLFAAGARPRDLGLLAGGIASLGLIMALAAPYRRDRLLTFLNPDADVTGSGFQIIQAKIAIGSGGFDGVGIGNGVQKAFYLPEAHTDMISAVIGEEFGLLGFAVLIAVFGLFGYAGFRIARSAKDDYGRILAAGLTGLILVQASLNLYAVMGMAPLTGIPLPLVSYGNNSLIVTLMAVGLILNVARGGRLAAARGGVPNHRRGQNAKLRLVEDHRDRSERAANRPPTRRTARSAQGFKAQSPNAQSRHSGGRNGGSRSAGHGRSRRASR